MEYEEWEDEQYKNPIYSYPPEEEWESMDKLKKFLIEMENRKTLDIEWEEGFLFNPGWINATIMAQHAQDVLGTDIENLVRRHLRGDWGDMVPNDLRQNDIALERGGRIYSAYNIEEGEKLLVITESDRSMTTCLAPIEYQKHKY